MFHVDDMFDKMVVISSNGLVKVLLSLFLLFHCSLVLYCILGFHSILSGGVGSQPKKSGLNLRDVGIELETLLHSC